MFRKIISTVIACTLILVICVQYNTAPLTINALTDGNGIEFTKGTYESLTYWKYSKHIVIWKCDESAEIVDIPPEIEGLPVTSILNMAFSSCKSLTKVTIPDSVTSIGSSAFYFCKNLSEIVIPDTATEIGEDAFTGTKWLKNKLTENPFAIVNNILISVNDTTCGNNVIIPDGVTSIGGSAFNSCRNPTKITIPDSVTEIGENAFFFCFNLTEITIPDSVTKIDKNAFVLCKKLTKITILNKDCEIDGNRTAISNGFDDYIGDYYNGVICGYEKSTAQVYAEKFGYKFESLGKAPTKKLPVLPIVCGSVGAAVIAGIAITVIIIKRRKTASWD